MEFIGRRSELEDLNLLFKKKSSSLVVIRGRRRIGKSRMISEFVKDKKNWIFSGLPPVPETTKQSQLDIFANKMAQNLNMPKLQVSEWSELFWHLGNQAKTGKIVIVFDEISWMGSKDPDFLGYLKDAWDNYFSRNPQLILILCGSVSGWIEENILSSTGFVGRVSVDMTLNELPLSKCMEFWGMQKNKISSYEKFKVLSITGGVPKYLEEIIPEQSAEANIQRLCFQPKGLLFREFDQIFSDLFSDSAPTYSSIVKTLENGALGLDQICDLLHIEKGGFISDCLHNLMLAGFITEDPTWNLKNKTVSNLKKFRLSDNYIRFYLKNILPNKEKISKGLFDSSTLSNFPGWESIMGLQFENLVLNNYKNLCSLIHVPMNDIVMVGPFFQRPTKRIKGCQIDLLIHTKHHILYLCEIKFQIAEIGPQIVDEVNHKIKRLSYPRGYSIRPILIHVNGVSQKLQNSSFFNQIVDFSELLSSNAQCV